METRFLSRRGERGCYGTEMGRGRRDPRYYYHARVTVTVTPLLGGSAQLSDLLNTRQAKFGDVEWRPSITLLPMPPRKSRKTTTKSKRKGKPRSSRQTTDNGNSRLHSTNSNTGLADQIVKAQALYGLGTVYTVHRDKSKVQRYSPPSGDTGEI